MNSIFGSFDALCAEFLGKAVRPSSDSITTNKDGDHSLFSSRGVTNKVSETMKKKQEGNVEKKQQTRPPRFAPELDGLNCFETFVSY
ncbi:hypothetical protein PTKIN_Ptkin05aG0080500 [Pterospermum kingtungense]